MNAQGRTSGQIFGGAKKNRWEGVYLFSRTKDAKKGPIFFPEQKTLRRGIYFYHSRPIETSKKFKGLIYIGYFLLKLI